MRGEIIFTGCGLYTPIIRHDGRVIWLYCYEAYPLCAVYVPSVANALKFADLYDVMSDTESASVVAQMETA